MEAFLIANMAPIMFASLVVVLLLGYPVAFGLAFNGLLWGVIGISLGLFHPTFFQALPERIFGVMGNETLLMLAIMVIVVIVGTALDMAPTILILTPILMPIVKQAGIDPVYFGVLFIINNSIGLITPPVGIVLNVVCGVSRISMEDIIKGVWPFMIAQLIVLFAMVLFPGLVTIPAKWFGG